MAGTGRAIRWNALVLTIGFLVLSVSAIKPNQSLGFLLSSAMLTCWGATLLFLPPLLKRLSFALLLLCLIWPGTASAQPKFDSAGSTVTPLEILRAVEVDYRRNPRVVSMDFTTIYHRRKFRPVKRAALVGEQMARVSNLLYRMPSCASLSMLGVLISEP